MAHKKKSAITKRKIADLKPHPKQESMFGYGSDTDFEALVANLKERGLRQPIEILPDGTIIDGHRRVRAAEALGWVEIDVIVRHDLEAAGPEAVETAFIEANFVRRQLSPLGRAKCLHRLIEIEGGDEASRLKTINGKQVKQIIAERMGLSERTVNRYLLVLQAPASVQQAFDRDELSLVNAGRVALLDKSEKEEIAQRILVCGFLGKKASEVVREHLARHDDRIVVNEPDSAAIRIVGCLVREVPRIKNRIDEVRPGRFEREVPVLKTACDLLVQIIERAGAAS